MFRAMQKSPLFDIVNSGWSPRPQPDGRVAVYYFSRRAYVLLSASDYREFQQLNFRTLIVCLMVMGPCFPLWIMYLEGQMRLQITVPVTAAALAIAIILETWIKRRLTDILMRAPLSQEVVRPLVWRELVGSALAAMSDRALSRGLFHLYLVLVALALWPVMHLTGDASEPPAKTSAVIGYVVLTPCVIALLITLRRERARRANKPVPPSDESVS